MPYLTKHHEDVGLVDIIGKRQPSSLEENKCPLFIVPCMKILFILKNGHFGGLAPWDTLTENCEKDRVGQTFRHKWGPLVNVKGSAVDRPDRTRTRLTEIPKTNLILTRAGHWNCGLSRLNETLSRSLCTYARAPRWRFKLRVGNLGLWLHKGGVWTPIAISIHKITIFHIFVLYSVVNVYFSVIVASILAMHLPNDQLAFSKGDS